jgi:hypothetical protein
MNSGEMTPQEADARYGRPQPGDKKPRRWPRLADYLREQIPLLEDPARQEKLVQDMIKLDQDKTLKPIQKRNEVVRQRKELDHTDPEYIARLREHLQAMEDPVGHAADRETLRAQVEARTAELAGRNRPVEDAPLPPEPPAGIDPRSSRYVKISQDPRINANYESAFRASEKYDAPFMARDAAGVIANDPLVRSELGPLHEVATRLMNQVPPDIPIMSLERARAEGRISQALHDDLQRRGVYGAYDPESRTILQNINGERLTGTHVETALHEMVHAISWHYLNNLERTAGRTHADLRALHAIRGELARHVTQEQLAKTLTETERQRLIKAIQNNHELHTQLMTDPVVQAFAASRQASPALLDTLRNLGHAPTAGQSIWRSFANWVRKATGQRPARSASEFTLFDHIIKPVTDITDRAAEYNKRFLPQDPVLRARAEPLYDAATGALGPRVAATKDALLDHVDLGGMGAAARRAALQFATSDGIVSRYRALMPRLDDWRRSQENIAHAGSKFARQVKYGADAVQAMTGRYKALKDAVALGRLMTDATLHEAHLGRDLPAEANAHLTTEAQQNKRAELQARYDKLSKPAQDLYGQLRETYKNWYDQTRSAQLTELMNRGIPDATQAQRDAFATAAKSQKSMDAFTKNPDNSAVARAFGDNWKDNAPLVKAMAAIHRLGYVQGDYFPLRRFGKYVITYGDRDTPGDYGMEMFEHRNDAMKRRSELLKANEADVSPVVLKREYGQRDIAPNHPAVSELVDALGRRGYDAAEQGEVRDALNAILMQHATHSERARMAMRREGVRGASINHAQVLNHEFLNTQARIGQLQHGAELAEAMRQMRYDLDALERNPAASSADAIKAGSVFREIQKRGVPIDSDNALSTALSRVNQWSFANGLLSPSHWVTATGEAHTNAAALLAGRHNPGRATLALSRAMAQVAPTLGKTGAAHTMKALRNQLQASDWNLLDTIRQRLIDSDPTKRSLNTKLTNELDRTGLVDHTMLTDMRRNANAPGLVGGRAGAAWNWFNNLTQVGSHTVDVMNKTAIAKAAADLEYERLGKDPTLSKAAREDRAIAYAIETTRNAIPNYNQYNAPRIATQRGTLGALGAPLFQFKRYGLHMYNMMANLVHVSRAGATAEERKAAALGFAGLLATHAMTAGVITLVADPLRYGMGLYDLATGNAQGKTHNYEDNAREFIASVFGKQAGEIISRGLPHALGIDVHRRIGLANLLEIPELQSWDLQGVEGVALGLATGAAGGNLINMTDGVMKATQGDLGGALKTMMPREIRNAMQAYDLATQGLKTQAGRTLLPQVGTGAVVAQSLGFQPAGVSEAREASNAVQQARDEAKAAQTRLSHAWVQADPAGRTAIWQQIVQHNQDPNNLGFRITMDQLQRDLQAQRRQAAQPGGFGLRLPRRGAGTLEQAGAFANF